MVCAGLAAALSAPTGAQVVDHAFTRSEVLDTISLQNDADMDFGDIIPSNANGTVVMTPSATPTCTATNGIVRTGPCKAAMFTGTAFPLADLRVMRPSGNRIDLTGPGGRTMRVNAFTFASTGPTTYLGNTGANHRFRVGATDGAYTFYVGGTLNVAANQQPGIYNGTFEIRLTYN